MTTSRYLCPLDCGWHHDQPDFDPTLPQPFSSQPAPEGVDPDAWGYTLGRALVVEEALKEHLQTHGLLTWVQALTGAQQRIATMEAEQQRYEETVVGALNETITRLSRQVARAEAEPAILDGTPREELVELITGRGRGVRLAVVRDAGGEPAEPEDGVDLSELTREDALELVDELGQQAYQAEDRLAFVREMCDQADREHRQVTTEQVRAWTNYTGCANATPEGASLAKSLGFAMAAMQPGHEPVLCHHEHRTVRWRTAGGVTTATATCKTCPARAESTEGEPELAPYLLNAERCTDACAERHTNGPGCLMAPDWSKPILRRKT